MLEEWTVTRERTPDEYGTFTVKRFRDDGTYRIGVATFYPDGKWYTQDGKPTRPPDMWKPYRKRPPKAKTRRYD